MKNLGILIASVGIILFFAIGTYFNYVFGTIAAILFVALSFIIIALGEISSDLREINNILRNVFPDKIPQNTEPSVSQKTCPACGDTHDADFPRCPKCHYDYKTF